MAFLICRYASPRSRPEKIQDWIAHLEQMLGEHRHDPERVQVIESMLSQARHWLRAD